MANDTTVVSGLDALNKALQELPVKIERNALRGALRAGQKEIADLARSRVPVASGELRKSIRIKTSARGGKVTATVVAGNRKAWYAHLVEWGTRVHTIRGTANTGLKFLSKVGVVVRNAVEHPGARAKPFMRPALDAGQRPALEAFAAYMRRRIDKEQLKGQDTQP